MVKKIVDEIIQRIKNGEKNTLLDFSDEVIDIEDIRALKPYLIDSNQKFSLQNQ